MISYPVNSFQIGLQCVLSHCLKMGIINKVELNNWDFGNKVIIILLKMIKMFINNLVTIVILYVKCSNAKSQISISLVIIGMVSGLINVSLSTCQNTSCPRGGCQ